MEVDDEGLEIAWHTLCLNHHRTLGFSILGLREALKVYLQYVKDKDDRPDNESGL